MDNVFIEAMVMLYVLGWHWQQTNKKAP